MILTCPICATRYQTDASSFMPDGRKVRCAKCGHVWHQAPETASGAPAAIETPAPAAAAAPVPPQPEAPPQRAAFTPAPAMASPVAARTPPPPSRAGSATVQSMFSPARWLEPLGITVGWLALASIVLVIGWSAVHFRQDIAGLWPQSSTLYAAVGMKVNTLGVEFRGKDAHFEQDNGQDVLVITGKVINVTSHPLTVPPIRVSLLGDDHREIYNWSFSPGTASLGPGQILPFSTRLPNPPATARHIELRFAAKGH
jgi:predicted Zn finger-like uncharacterized protein